MSTGDFAQQQQQAFGAALAGLQEGPEIQLVAGQPNRVRVLPRYKPDGTQEVYFFAQFTVHWSVGPNNKLVRCLRPEGQPCAVCDYVKQLIESGHEDAAQKMQASNRFLMAAVPLNVPPENQKPKILACGSQVLEGILTKAVNPQWGDPSHPTNGYGIIIFKTGTGFATRYTVDSDRERMPINQEWMSKLPDLGRHYRAYSYQEQQMLLAGQDPNQAQQQTMPPPQQQAAPPQQQTTPPQQQAAPPQQQTTPTQQQTAPPPTQTQGVPPTQQQTAPPPTQTQGAPPPNVGTPAVPPQTQTQSAPPPNVGTPAVPPQTQVTGGEAPKVEPPLPPDKDFQATPPQ